MQPRWRSQWRKCLWSHVSHFKTGEKNISTSFDLSFQSKPQHGCSQRSSQRAYDRLGFANHATRMPSMSTTVCDLVVLLLCWPLFLFNKLHSQLLISIGCPIILAFKALCKVRGGPLWCLTAPAGSDPGLPLGCPANLCWATGPLAEIYSYISENISHITCIWHDPVYLISSESSGRQLKSWDFKFNWSES